jgi:DNA-directed RNA polymerase specialized sigma24 family protein
MADSLTELLQSSLASAPSDTGRKLHESALMQAMTKMLGGLHGTTPQSSGAAALRREQRYAQGERDLSATPGLFSRVMSALQSAISPVDIVTGMPNAGPAAPAAIGFEQLMQPAVQKVLKGLVGKARSASPALRNLQSDEDLLNNIMIHAVEKGEGFADTTPEAANKYITTLAKNYLSGELQSSQQELRRFLTDAGGEEGGENVAKIIEQVADTRATPAQAVIDPAVESTSAIGAADARLALNELIDKISNPISRSVTRGVNLDKLEEGAKPMNVMDLARQWGLKRPDIVQKKAEGKAQLEYIAKHGEDPQELLQGALAALRDKHPPKGMKIPDVRDAVQLYINGQSGRSAAEIMEISESNYRKLLQHGINLLRKQGVID